MNSRLIKITTLLSLMIAYIFIYKYYIFDSYLEYSEYITAAFTICITFLSIKFFGYQKDKMTEVKKSVLMTEIILLIGFFAIYYGSGLITGFLKSSYAFNLSSIIYNILALTVIVSCIEIFRYVMITADRENKMHRIVTTIVICIFEIVIVTLGRSLINYEDMFKVFAQIILPLIAKNYAMTYIVRFAGLKPTLIFRLIIELYIYLVPIVPDIGDYFNAIVKIGLPMLLFIFSYRIIDDHINGIEYDFKKSLIKKSDTPVIIFIILISLLISGKFQYHLIGIGSESMSPAIRKGDAVLLDKGKKAINNVKNEDIIAYEKDGILIIHRIVEINNIKGTKYYKVKGDANNSADNVELTNEDIVGVVRIKFKYIGYPSVFINENFNK